MGLTVLVNIFQIHPRKTFVFWDRVGRKQEEEEKLKEEERKKGYREDEGEGESTALSL